MAATRAIAGALSAALGCAFEPVDVSPVGGGDIHQALRLGGPAGGRRRDFFAKVAGAGRAAMFAAEADGLEALRANGAITVPAVVARGADDTHAWLVLEWLELAPLAAMHRAPQARFGWERDNFIGASPQANGWSDDWLAFWRERRLAAQLRLAAGNRLPSRLIDRGERLAADCGAFFRHHAPPPSLLHGDLWGGNAAALPDGSPVVFDPAAHAGDREADVAMTELFGGFPADFLAAYRAAWELPDGYRVRRDLYNLYHLLNHANLFAGGYVRRSEQAIERLLAQL